MDLGLKDKRVVITGSSRGIGYAIAEAFLAEGARVMLNGVDPKRLADAERALQTADQRVSSIAANVASVDGVATLFGAIDRHWDGLDVCINNAAIHEAGDFTRLEGDLWDRTINMNLKSTYLCAQAAFERMSRLQTGGVILNASSFAAVIPAYPYGIYGMTKAAIINMTRAMAAEFAPWNIRVNAYVPGLIATEMNAETLAKSGALAISQIALNRPGTVDDAAAPVVFLASEKAGYITGAALEISGGKFSVQNPKGNWDRAERLASEKI